MANTFLNSVAGQGFAADNTVFGKCIQRHVQDKNLKKSQADRAFVTMENLHDLYVKQGMSGPDAEALAERQTVSRLNEEIDTKRLQKAIDLKAREDAVAQMQGAKNNRGGMAQRLVQKAEDAEIGAKAAMDHIMQPMAEVIERYRSTIGNRVMSLVRDNTKLGFDILREMDGKNTGNMLARMFSDMVKESDKRATSLFNSVSGNGLHQLDNFKPRNWDSVGIYNFGKENFVEFLKKYGQWDKIEQGQLRTMDERARTAFAEKAFDNLIDEHRNQITPGQGGTRKMANAYSASRAIHLTTEGETALYQNKLVEGNVFENILSHYHDMSHRIGVMQEFGTNPNAFERWAKQYVESQHTIEKLGKSQEEVKDIRGQQTKLLNRFSRGMDELNRRQSLTEPNLGAKIIAGTQQVLGPAMLAHGAVTSFAGDMSTSVSNSLKIGVPFHKVFANYLKNMTPIIGEMRRKLLARNGLMIDAYIGTATTRARYFDSTLNNKDIRNVVDIGYRLNGITPHTQGIKAANFEGTMGRLSDVAHLPFDKLSAGNKYLLNASRITPEEWDIIRATKPDEMKGWFGTTSRITPEGIFSRSDITPEQARDLSLKYTGMLRREGSMAVPETTVTSRAAMPYTKNINGDIPGAVQASLSQFYSFIYAYVHGPLSRVYDESGKMDFSYTTALAVSGLVAAAFVEVESALDQGKDPPDFRKPAEWVNVAQRLDMLGIASSLVKFNPIKGDLENNSESSVGGFFGDVANVGIAGVRQLMGQKASVGQAAVRAGRKYDPLEHLPVVGLAFKRKVVDQIQERLDPHARQSFRNQVRNAKKMYGQGYYWGPGQDSPSRAPNLGNAIGTGQ